ncbi:zinc finger and SCAN domain-containing protein 18-like [Salarias fasciatus]|uniref:zinc finger and SCAN domain-containing protein 18-like n=1 Tax=Salarias fasciatus TaxID=181472 RepID=UPI0011764C37|nr:zinc finger and SCAN domain-containing protein 18-like [Salarias fasciatus]
MLEQTFCQFQKKIPPQSGPLDATFNHQTRVSTRGSQLISCSVDMKRAEPGDIKEEPEDSEPQRFKEEPGDSEPKTVKEEPGESEPHRVHEALQEFSRSPQAENVVLNEESDSFMETSTEEGSDRSEPESDGEQLVSHGTNPEHRSPELRHQGEKPQKTHKKERRHSCDACGKHFTVRSHLSAHANSHG